MESLSRVKGTLTTNVDPNHKLLVEQMEISYDDDVARDYPEQTAIALANEALHVLSERHRANLNDAEFNNVRRRVNHIAGNQHSGDVIRQYSLTEEGVTLSTQIFGACLGFPYDFYSRNTIIDEAQADNRVGHEDRGEFIADLWADMEVLREEGMSASGVFAMALTHACIFALKEGADRFVLIDHMHQVIQGLIDGSLMPGGFDDLDIDGLFDLIGIGR